MAADASGEVIRIAETLRMLQEHLQCVICLETLRDPVSTRCGHTFCQTCMDRIVTRKGALCPLCNTRVNRRGIIECEKIRNIVKIVHGIIAEAQKDISELGYEDVLLLPKENRSSAQRRSSIEGPKADPPLPSSVRKTGSKRTSKVESWLKGVHTPSSSNPEASSVPDDNLANDDSDSEMVSVSQIDPDHPTTRVAMPVKNKPLSAQIEDDVDAEEGFKKKQPNKKTTRRSITSKKAAPLKVKSKQQSLKGFMTPKATPTKANSISVCPDFEIKVPDPVIVLMDLEKENTTSVLPTRSPGWSRVQKMKKDFHQPSKVLLSTNSKGNRSPVPSIEDAGSSDEQPCLNLSLDSPVLKKKARMNEIVNSLASEIETIEKSTLLVEKKANQNPSSASKVSRNNEIVNSFASEIETIGKPTLPVEKKTNQNLSTASQFSRNYEILNSLASESEIIEKSTTPVGKKATLNPSMASKVSRNNFQAISRDAELFPRRSIVQFLKLGPIVAKKTPRVPIYIMGSTEQLYCVDVMPNPHRIFANAHTQTDSETLNNCQKAASKNVESPLSTFKSPPPRRSEGANSDCDMDAETVLFSQPVSAGSRNVPVPVLRSTLFDTEIIESTFPEGNEQSQQSNSIICSQKAVPCPEKISDNFTDGDKQSHHTQLILSSQDSDKSPEKTMYFDTTSNNIPQVNLDDSWASSYESRGLKRSHIFRSLSGSSDSDVGVTTNQNQKKKKKKVQVLSDNEDSCSNDPEISIVDTSKILAHIEAQLDDDERMQSSGLPDQDEQESVVVNNHASVNLETFDENLDVPLDTSRTQIDSDGDSDVIHPTPHRPNSIISRQTTQSDDIVLSSQPPVGNLAVPAALLQNPHVDPPMNNGGNLQENYRPSQTEVDQEEPCEESADQKKKSCTEVSHLEASEQIMFSEIMDSAPKLSSTAKLVFVCSSLPSSSVAQVEKLAKMFGAEFSSKFTPETSHLIVRVDESNKADKTLKYLSAVAAGKWVVSFAWVQKCLETETLIPEEPYEALDASGEPGPQRSREARVIGKKLFGGFEFCCVGDFPDLSKGQMQDLLVDCGATIVKKPTDFSFQDRIIPISVTQWDESKEAENSSWFEAYSTPLVQHDWVLECIGKFCVTSFSSMLLCDVSDDYLTSMGIPAYLFELSELE